MNTYSRPSFAELSARIEVDLAALPTVLRTPLAKMWAEGNHSSHGFLDWIYLQCSPLTCDEERLYDWAALYAVERLAATNAAGPALATGTLGTPLLVDTELRAQSNGLDYLVSVGATLGVSQTAVTVRCTTSGSSGNLAAGAALALIDPVPGVDSDITVGAAGVTGGADQENIDDWRARVCEEWQTIVSTGARSGKPADYRFWAKSAHPSVTGALVQPHVLGTGTVVVRPICDDLLDRLPTAAVLGAVESYLDGIAPATADWRVIAPIKRAVDAQLHLLPGYDTAQNRTAIESALDAAVLAETDEDAVLAMAEIDVAIATVTSQYTRLAPLADIAVAPGEVLVMESVTWA